MDKDSIQALLGEARQRTTETGKRLASGISKGAQCVRARATSPETKESLGKARAQVDSATKAVDHANRLITAHPLAATAAVAAAGALLAWLMPKKTAPGSDDIDVTDASSSEAEQESPPAQPDATD